MPELTTSLPGPLAGVVVADFSRVVSGPSCAKALADLGARVIKIEPPDGDMTRHDWPRLGGISAYFAQQNAGKECVSIDLATDEGRHLGLELSARADVVVENFRPGVVDRLGIGYETVAERRPDTIFCSISGYGQTGPNRDRRAYAPVVHAEVGLMELTARKRDQDPVNEVVVWADLFTGMQAALAVVSALLHRDRTGLGSHLDISMAETMLQSTQFSASELNGGQGDHLTVFNGEHAPVLRIGDGSAAIVPGDPVSTFPGWVKIIGRPELLEDPRLVDRRTRADNRSLVNQLIADWAASVGSFEEFEAAIGAQRFAAGKVRTLADAAEQDWAVDRGAVVTVGNEEHRVPRGAIRSNSFSAHVRGGAGWQGKDNVSVCVEVLGLDNAEISRLEDAGVLIERRPEPSGD